MKQRGLKERKGQKRKKRLELATDVDDEERGDPADQTEIRDEQQSRLCHQKKIGRRHEPK